LNQPVIVLVEDNADDELLTKRAFARQNFSNPLVVLRDGVEAVDYFFGPHAATNRLTPKASGNTKESLR